MDVEIALFMGGATTTDITLLPSARDAMFARRQTSNGFSR